MPIFHTQVTSRSNSWIWEQETEEPFVELILSWNGFRPQVGFWEFSVSLFQNEWSPWLKYAQWGAGRQQTFRSILDASFASTNQDVVRPKCGHCSAFRLEILAQEGADLVGLQTVTAAISNTTKPTQPQLLDSPLSSISLSWIPRQSQQILPHLRCKDLCSPTSTSAAINYLLNHKTIDPTIFAEAVRDQQFDIYGNWILNTAAAYEALQGKYRTYVARLPSFAEALKHIAKGLPLIVSVKGPLEGAPLPYAHGHLILLTGYDQHSERVLCMDPGFPTDEQTQASYEVGHFVEAWGRRRNLAYVFEVNSYFFIS